MRQPDTEAIIEACKHGDREAFRTLFETYKDRVYSIALHYGGDESAARDVTQQVFLKLFSAIGQFRRDAEFTTWLYRVVVNACVDEQRKGRRFVPLTEGIEAPVASAGSSQEEAYIRRQTADSVRSAVKELSPKLRLPILLKYVEGLSYEEIARTLNVSIGTVSSRLNRGHRELARRLGHLRSQVLAGE
jgi:RNA polymerase sigma-70 factor (ECF subfamily)